VTAAELDAIENALGWPLPRHYRRFMLAYPTSLVEAKPRDWEPITAWEFANTPQRIIEWNRYVRRQPEGTFVEGPWPDNYFIIGAEEGGNYYVIDRYAVEEAVFLWLHDTGEFSAEAESVPQFVDWLIDYFWQFKDEDGQGQTDQVAAQIHREMAEVKRPASSCPRPRREPKSKKPNRRKRQK
jgi:hypothetical protein